MNKTINLFVKEEESNQRVDAFINNKEKSLSRTRIKNLILKKNLKLNSQILISPAKKLTFDKKNKISDNLFYYTGNPKKIYKDDLNFFNPSCFIFPKENNCIPGDMFKKNQINELENFLNYKTFKFKLSNLQKKFNYISLISLIFSICFIIYYLIKKIISNKSPNEQNY